MKCPIGLKIFSNVLIVCVNKLKMCSNNVIICPDALMSCRNELKIYISVELDEMLKQLAKEYSLVFTLIANSCLLQKSGACNWRETKFQ